MYIDAMVDAEVLMDLLDRLALDELNANTDIARNMIEEQVSQGWGICTKAFKFNYK
jgi:hypothetical protein